MNKPISVNTVSYANKPISELEGHNRADHKVVKTFSKMDMGFENLVTDVSNASEYITLFG